MEVRYDPVRDLHVVVSPVRGKRPVEYRQVPEHSDPHGCPFCPGKEDKTPPEVYRYPQEGPWRIRVVPNRYPIIPGMHEVVIETPEHEATLWSMGIDQIEIYLSTIAGRVSALASRDNVRHISIFKNHGHSAGASLSHPHTQIVALPFIPSRVERELKRFNRSCPLCEMLSSPKNVVIETENFLAFCPEASIFPYEVWIAPVSHRKRFEETEETEELATVISNSFRLLNRILGNFPFNMLVITPASTVAHNHHWRIEILPRITTMAGLELATGTFVNPVPPEEASERLRVKQGPDETP